MEAVLGASAASYSSKGTWGGGVNGWGALVTFPARKLHPAVFTPGLDKHSLCNEGDSQKHLSAFLVTNPDKFLKTSNGVFNAQLIHLCLMSVSLQAWKSSFPSRSLPGGSLVGVFGAARTA